MKKRQSNRKLWFKCFKKIIILFKKKPTYIFLGEKFSDQSLILSNHAGASGPLCFELYSNLPIRHWGAHQMNEGLISVYKYLTNIYYHGKHHWNIHLARFVCIFVAPLTNLFYKGLRLIPTYPDFRLKQTFKESYNILKNQESIVIYPEDSSNGYFDEVTSFHSGFVCLGKYCLKHDLDLPIYVCYYRKKDNKCIVSKPIKYSQLAEKNFSRNKLAQIVKEKCNELGKLQFDENGK